MPPHKDDKAIIYRGRLELNKPTDIFQAVFNLHFRPGTKGLPVYSNRCAASPYPP
jgi:hypothetical protein